MQWPSGQAETSSLGTPSPTQMSSSTSNKSTSPTYALCVHPVLWNRDDVQAWINWCINEYAFTDVQQDTFSMNGKALILMKKEDFVERAPSAGAVLYHSLHKLIEAQQARPGSGMGGMMAEQAALMNLLIQSNPFLSSGLIMPGISGLPLTGAAGVVPPQSLSSLVTSSSMTPSTLGASLLASNPLLNNRGVSNSNPALHSGSEHRIKDEAYSSCTDHKAHTDHLEKINSVIKSTKSLPGNLLSGHISTSNSFIKREEPLNLDTSSDRPKNDCRLLWEFISKLLKDQSYSDYIRWENPADYTFRIVNPAQLSRLWGIQKNRTNMTYEKLSRALRYYYRMDIIEKVPGRRLTYRFMRPPHEIKRGQRGAKPGIPHKYEENEDIDMETYPDNSSDLSDEITPSHALSSPVYPYDLSAYQSPATDSLRLSHGIQQAESNLAIKPEPHIDVDDNDTVSKHMRAVQSH